VTAPL